MKKCISGRQTGKTEKLIILSGEKQIPILTLSNQSAHEIEKRSIEMGISIPVPISVKEIMSDNYLNNIGEIDSIIVDDADHVLKSILRTRKIHNVEAISICNNDISDKII